MALGDNCSIHFSDENILIIVSNNETHHASCISVTHPSKPNIFLDMASSLSEFEHLPAINVPFHFPKERNPEQSRRVVSSLLHSILMFAPLALLCHKEPAQGTQGISCILLVLSGISAPIIDPPLCQKESAGGILCFFLVP